MRWCALGLSALAAGVSLHAGTAAAAEAAAAAPAATSASATAATATTSTSTQATGLEGPLQNQLRVDLGWASPVGFIGGIYERVFADFFSLEAGIGFGFTGLQLSLLPKLVVRKNEHSIFFGIGASLGWRPNAFKTDSGAGMFVNAEVGYGYQARSGFVFIAAIGVTYTPQGALPKTELSCGAGGCPAVPTMRIGFGRAF